MTNIEIKKYYIAYFDVLGYKSFFEDKEDKAEILEFLKSIIRLAKDTIRKATRINSSAGIHVKSFSDNFMVLLDETISESEKDALAALSYLMAQLQMRFLEKYSILIRGCITKGLAYLDENIVFGEGLIRAVHLEQEACFPRIVIDKKSIDQDLLSGANDGYISKDEDEEYYVNFLNYFNAKSEKSIPVIRNNIIKLVNKHGKFNRAVKDPKKILEEERTISKYAWILAKYNQYCDLTKGKFEPISYNFVLYSRLMKCEIVVERQQS